MIIISPYVGALFARFNQILLLIPQLAAIKNSPHVVQGAVSTGHQYHFHMETQVWNISL